VFKRKTNLRVDAPDSTREIHYLAQPHAFTDCAALGAVDRRDNGAITGFNEKERAFRGFTNGHPWVCPAAYTQVWVPWIDGPDGTAPKMRAMDGPDLLDLCIRLFLPSKDVREAATRVIRLRYAGAVELVLPGGSRVRVKLCDDGDALPELDIALVNADGSDRPEIVNLYKSGLKAAAPAVEACQLIIPLDRRRDVNAKANST
jgi:hypothetical protein